MYTIKGCEEVAGTLGEMFLQIFSRMKFGDLIIQRDSKRWTQFHTSIFPEL
jgi:phytoene/squalene synthetase